MDATTSPIPNRCTFTPSKNGDQLQGGRYVIQKLLGKGGMGIVYLAADRNLPGRFVAIKENSDASCPAQEQFQQEATILARLNHPNLPRVTDHFIEPSGRQYLVMDYIEGSDLREILKEQRGPLPETVVLAWIEQVMNALEYLHHWFNPATNSPSPIVHRDIKPGNIKLTPTDCVVLVDFGLAKYEEEREGNNTSVRSVTAGYSPVEQYAGGATIGSDIYALGATLYTLLTGQRAPDSPALATGTPLPAPRQLNPQISCNTEQVILCAMQAQASKRYRNIAEMRAALQNRGKLVKAPHNFIQQTIVYTLPPQRVQRRHFPNLRILSIGLLLLLVLAIGIVLSTPNGKPWNELSMLTPLSSVTIPYLSLSGVYDLVDRTEQMRQHLASFSAEDGFLLVAEDVHGKGIGFSSGGDYGADQPGCGEIYTLYVLPDRQGQGVGQRLLVASAQRLWQAGHNRLQIWTLAANPARGFYERLGGVVVQQRVSMIGGAILPEVAYSWGNLEALVSQASPEVKSSPGNS